MISILGFEVDLLTFITLFPVVAAVMTILLPRQNPNLSRYFALAMSLVVLVPSIAIFVLTHRAELAPGEFAFESSQEWFTLMGSSWHLGVDGISAAMILLTAILTPVAIIIAFEHDDRPTELMALMLFMETGMMGVFASLDMLVFFLFYEIGLVPMYFIIYLWGGSNRDFAARKFFIFTMAGSLGLLLSIQMIAVVVGNAVDAGTPLFDITVWYQEWPKLSMETDILGFSASAVKWLALIGFTLAFALKIPIFPLHTWLPDAHTEAPTAGSMLLAGVLLKLGAYGFIRLVIPLFPLEWVATRELAILGLEFQAVQVLGVLAMVSIVFGAFSAWAQDDFKKLVAYSSVNHMGFVAMGLAVFAAVYGASYAVSVEGGTRPDLVLSSFGESMTIDEVGEYVSVAERSGLGESQQIKLASYVKLIQDEEAVVDCGGDSTPTAANLGSCHLVSIPRLTGSGEELGDMHHATLAANGAVMQMFNHGLSAAGMFLLVGALYHKAHTRDLRRFGGLWHTIPAYGAVLVFTSMASLGLPGLNGFIGEYLVVAGAFPVAGFHILILLSLVGLLITGAYILKGLQKVLHGPVNPEWQHYHDHHHSLELTRREMIAISPLIVLMLVTGVFPNWILPTINHSVNAMLAALLGG